MIASIAIDDEPLALELLTDYASRTEGLDLLKTFTNPLDALKYLENIAVDLLFLDIQMPDISGINFYKLVRQNPMVIFTTAYSKYAVEGFNLSAVDYLLKPIEYNRFVLSVTKAKDYKEFINRDTKSIDKCIHVRSGYCLVKIKVNEIGYIESFDDFIKIHIMGNNPIMTLMSLKAIIELLPSDQFMRVHRSYIVRLDQIKSVRNNRVQLINTEVLPLGITYKEEFLVWFKSNRE